jgi:hypothetical protein
MIKIEQTSNTFEYKVSVSKDGKTEHIVFLADDTYNLICARKVSQTELIKQSFIFLLEDIKKYFPEYPKAIINYINQI